MKLSRVSKILAMIVVAGVMAALGPATASAQIGGIGGGIGGVGGGIGGGIGGVGGGGFGQQGAGVVVDAQGVLRVKTYNDPGNQIHRQRFAAAKASLRSDLVKPTDLRMVSLNRLEAAVAERLANGEEPTDEMKNLAGLLRLQYVFYYPESKDIVIAGPAEGFVEDLSGRVRGIMTGWPTLQLQDLVVALRAFAPGKPGAKVIGVSIDPSPEGLQRMQNFLASLNGRVTPGMDRQIAQGLRSSLGLQTVSVQGISPNTHFAQVLVEADYRMKLIGIGLERVPKTVGIRSWVDRANPRSVARNAMQRWYFTPNYDCVRVADDEMGMELVGFGVKLIGQDELVQADGVRVQSAAADPASKAFCENFTERYPKLAELNPVYAQMRNLIDMSVAAAFVQQQDYYGQAGWNMELFADEQRFPVETYTTPRTVETAVNVIWRGNRLMTPIGGGVNIQPRSAIETSRMMRDEEKTVQKTRAQIQVELRSLDSNRWWWD